MLTTTPAFLIHERLQLEKHTWLTFFTPCKGLISTLRYRSKQRSYPPFQPFSLELVVKDSSVKVKRIEIDGFLPPLTYPCNWAGMYINELIYKALAEGETHTTLYTLYSHTIKTLSATPNDMLATIRQFEHALQINLGYALSYECLDAHPHHMWFSFDPQEGLKPSHHTLTYAFSRSALLLLQQQAWQHPVTQDTSKRIFQRVLKNILGENALFIKNTLPASLK